MNYNTRDYIRTVTEIDRNQQVSNNVTWATVVRKEKIIPSPRGKGEIPYQMELKKMNNTKFTKKKNHKMLTPSEKKTALINQENSNDECIYNKNNFSHIASSVREANGGYNTQSNEMIEKRNRERQQKYIEENNSSDSSSSLNVSYVTASSETDSYKTTIQNHSDTIVEDYKEKCKGKMERFKKNALMMSLILQNALSITPNDDEEVQNISAEYLTESGWNEENKEKLYDSIGEEKLMRADNLVRLFQSQEDEDVYYHPLKEEIQKDPEWQSQRLSRKGTEVTYSARQYYMNVDNDSFAFEAVRRN